MKVLLHGYNTCCQNVSGGVQVRIRRIRELLRGAGVEADFFAPFETKLSDYDVLHVFGLNYETRSLISAAKTMGLKVVISTISIPEKERAKDAIRRRLIRAMRYYATVEHLTEENAAGADRLIVETPYERRFVCGKYHRREEDVLVIPNGIDPDPDGCPVPENPLGEGVRYLLQVGRFDRNKNQLNVIRALRDTGVPCVFVGGPGNSEEEKAYYADCVEAARGRDNFRFAGWFENGSERLLQYYRCADTLIVPSFYETFGMIVLEGGVRGCKLLLSDRIPIREYASLAGCRTFDPGDPEDIRGAVIRTLEDPPDDGLRRKIADEFSWETVVRRHVALYEELVNADERA